MKNTLYALLVAVLVLLLSTAVGLGFIHITNQPYLESVDKLEIPETSGFSREEILENYNAVMDFLSPFSNKPFALPTMEYSPSGARHFEDCKPIFNAVYLLGLLAFLALALLVWRKKLSRNLLRTSGVLTLAIPMVFGCAIAIDFNKAFVLFHKLFFSNDDWLFDPATDEVITILPEEFFMQCAVLIAVFWLIAAAGQLIQTAIMKKD